MKSNDLLTCTSRSSNTAVAWSRKPMTWLPPISSHCPSHYYGSPLMKLSPLLWINLGVSLIFNLWLCLTANSYLSSCGETEVVSEKLLLTSYVDKHHHQALSSWPHSVMNYPPFTSPLLSSLFVFFPDPSGSKMWSGWILQICHPIYFSHDSSGLKPFLKWDLIESWTYKSVIQSTLFIISG